MVWSKCLQYRFHDVECGTGHAGGERLLPHPAGFRATLSADSVTGEMTLSWPSKPGVFYRIESSEHLDGDWLEVASHVPAAGTGSVTTYPLPSPGGATRMFYIAVIE